MVKLFQSFLVEEEGQDMVEYSLLLAFIAMAAVALLISARTSITGLWGTVNSSLTAANANATTGGS